MNLRKFRREEMSLNLTPLIDVVFLLLIFFMVTTTFREESEIEIDLPQASNQPVEQVGNPLEVVIDRDGRFYIGQKLVINTQLDTLKRALRKAKGDRKNPPLIISADAKSPHQAVVTAMDAARQVGLVRMSIATRNQNQQ
ncbi:MAG TPA: biopolymer transporter ExbD [Candidatus Tenderia electrophaga]|uniref:Biopolymer transporter ExbD n=1 Tax=Candidatus Tenderia electrophaga TaxID=1748243 RepID=A0A832J2X5_9GAMM|nr:biopolymer transporter ExbD [Candidatus Tenderia electrophaga]